VGEDRAETYLRLTAEARLRRAGRSARDVGSSVEQVRWAGEVLVAAGVLAEDQVRRIAAEHQAALSVRAGAELTSSRLSLAIWQLDGSWRQEAPPPAAAQQMRVTPVGATFRVTGGRAPADLYLMTLVSTPADAGITVAMRMRWPPDGSSADLESAGAGPEHLPYDQLWVADDRGTRYRTLLVGEGGTATWLGTLQLAPAPARGTRWLDLIADGTRRLVRLDLNAQAPAVRATTEPDPAVSPGERLLVRQAELILATAGASGAISVDPRLGEMITVLTGAGAIAADSPVPGHLAALGPRLGADPHGIGGVGGIAAPAAADIPGPWASVLAGLDAEPAGQGPDWFAPLAVILPDVDGARFALAGLTHAEGESHLHVVASGGPERAAPGWDPGYSWWVRDDVGTWHVARETVRSQGSLARGPGWDVRWLRLTPPLRSCPEAIEVVVTGPATRVRAVVPVREGAAMADT
jgi:hypothetical protein